jgi:cob(I)alamin adenosyltransferase
MNKFYTKKGDDGYTSLLGKGRVAKYDLRIETVGAIDEANAAIALSRTFSKVPLTSEILLDIQRDLYHVMAEISTTPENASRFSEIGAENVTWLENQIEAISVQVVIPSEFIIPGDSQAGAALDLARTITRRAERHIAHLIHLKQLQNSELLRYINRLSSLFFVLELLENNAAGVSKPTLAKQ